jgi:3-oxoacyl-[acyl-carrier protein] reductase
MSVSIDLSGRVAIVTGASRGIGRGIASALGEAGARVVINYRRSASEAEELAEQIGGLAVQADVSTSEGCDALIEAAEGLGQGLHILVNNAGINRDGLMLRMTDEEWSTVLETNLGSCFRLTRSAGNIMMRQRSGSIINITSVSGIRGNAGQANYAASKAGITAMTRSMAKELGRRGVRLNCVAPGFIDTDMVQAMNPKVVEGVRKAVPMRRLGLPGEVGNVVLFLASDLASYVTGQEWVVDGGLAI